MQDQDDTAVSDTIKAIARTISLLEASGINNHTLIGVLSGTLSARIMSETPEFQIALRAMLAKKFSGAA